MASPTGSSPSSAPKTKHERIRDNQRRSRARRQEYLADLERRLRESHSLCREADLQKAAVSDLQRENGHLRHLLNMSGVTSDVVETFLRQNATKGDGPGNDGFSSGRQLKPKLPLLTVPAFEPSPASSIESRSASAQSYGKPTTPLYDPSMGVAGGQGMYTEAKLCTADPSRLQGNDPRSALAVDINWLFDVAAGRQAEASQQDSGFLCCDSFLLPANGALLEDDRNAILCSVARDLIYQYNIPPRDMDAIKLRLATGFSRPSTPDAGCRVNNQLLFEVLNEIQAKYG